MDQAQASKVLLFERAAPQDIGSPSCLGSLFRGECAQTLGGLTLDGTDPPATRRSRPHASSCNASSRRVLEPYDKRLQRVRLAITMVCDE